VNQAPVRNLQAFVQLFDHRKSQVPLSTCKSAFKSDPVSAPIRHASYWFLVFGRVNSRRRFTMMRRLPGGPEHQVGVDLDSAYPANDAAIIPAYLCFFNT
jgi:hypothetical protein